jgi:drug/metabolite transporter (DMT)-like permease
MIFLILSIIISSFIFVIFKLFAKYKVNTLQAIVFNYITAFIFGFSLYGNQLNEAALTNLQWVPFIFICGFLFIFSFLIMAISSQKNGVALTSVAVKMSMAMSMVLMIIWYGEKISALKIIGIVLAILGVLFMSLPSKKKLSKEAKPIMWMLVVLFIGGGALDFTLNFTLNNVLQNLPASLFSAFGFAIAGIIGLLIMTYNLITKKSTFAFRNVLAGVALGIPNYFSIYLLMVSYDALPWTDSTILAVTNVSVVLISALMGFIAFKEELTSRKVFGLLAAVSAIVTLYFATL